MKKIILIITLMTLAATANAQFVISAQLGGSYSLGSTMPSATFYGHTPSGADSIAPIPMDTLNHQNPVQPSVQRYEALRIQSEPHPTRISQPSETHKPQCRL